jgi:hypothetical protein
MRSMPAISQTAIPVTSRVPPSLQKDDSWSVQLCTSSRLPCALPAAELLRKSSGSRSSAMNVSALVCKAAQTIIRQAARLLLRARAVLSMHTHSLSHEPAGSPTVLCADGANGTTRRHGHCDDLRETRRVAPQPTLRRLRRHVHPCGRLRLTGIVHESSPSGSLWRIAVWWMLFQVVARNDGHASPPRLWMTGGLPAAPFDELVLETVAHDHHVADALLPKEERRGSSRIVQRVVSHPHGRKVRGRASLDGRNQSEHLVSCILSQRARRAVRRRLPSQTRCARGFHAHRATRADGECSLMQARCWCPRPHSTN